jgi:hypothetical protein
MGLFSMTIGLEHMDLLEVFDKALGELEKQEFFGRASTDRSSKPAESASESENKLLAVNIRPLVESYPKLPSDETLAWMMTSVIHADDKTQVHWFTGLEQWATGFHDKDWAREVIDLLVQADIGQPQPVQPVRKDFDLAKEMFAGNNSRIIVGGEVISNQLRKGETAYENRTIAVGRF